MKKLLVFTLLSVLLGGTFALEIPDSSKASALGETSYIKNEFSIFANPALNYRLKHLRFKFNLLSFENEFFTTANLGLNLGDNTGFALGAALTKNAAYGISLSKKFDFISFGGTARYLQKKYPDNTPGMAFDLGTMIELKEMPSFAPDKILLSVNNLGDKVDLLGTNTIISSSATKIGLNWSKMGLGLDASMGDTFKASVSFDFNLDVISLRAGAIFDGDVRFSGGLGILMGEDEVCYSFSTQPGGGQMHSISLSVELTPSKTVEDATSQEKIEVDLKGNIKDYNNRAMELYQTGQLNEAIALWTRVLQLDKTNEFAERYIQKARGALSETVEKSRKSAEANLKAEKWDKALSDYDTISNLLPSDKDITAKVLAIKSKLIEAQNAGKIYFDDKQFIKAIEKWQWVLSRFPSYPDTEELIMKAQAELKKGSQEKDLLDKYYREASEAYAKGDLAATIEKLNRILALDAAFEPATTLQASLLKENFEAGLRFYGQNQYEKALLEWKKVLIIDPSNEKAKFYINEAEQLIKDKITKYFNEGILNYNAGEYTKAIISWRQGLATDPTHKEMSEYMVKAMISEGILLYRQDKIKEAVSYWEQADKIKPNEEKVTLYLKRAKNKLKMLAELEGK